MAVADLMVLTFDVILYEIIDAYFPHSSFNQTTVCRVILTMLFISIDCSVWLTVAFTFDRFVAICHQMLRAKYCTERNATVAIAVVFSASIVENIPYYFIYEPREVVNDVEWSCYVKSSFYTLPIWAAFLWLETILTPFAPYVLILLLNSLTIRHIILANRVRSGLRGNNSNAKHTDPELENRRKSIVLLLAISGSFILLWMVNLICFICVQFTDTQFLEASFNDPFTIAELSGYMLKFLSSCTNTFIYAVSQRKFRDELKNVIKYPATLVLKVIDLKK
ncbi:probable G-protein coupled receptor 139 [Leucoraja erinacea]|uniref:probable G-protein coupled receptor 139 n=1 Tax=Leucoraja erinaceus TaxID=7782 RepID=UPI002455F59F|nr:probable G-protein coupled receptor 139 [Leucoraja erinacea]